MKEKTKKRTKPEILSRAPYRRRKEPEMLKIISEINSGIISKRAACAKHGLNRRTLARFISTYSMRTLGYDLSTQLLSGMTEDKKTKLLEKQVKDLQKSLEQARLKIDSLETIIKVAEEDLHIRIRKKRGTKQSKE